MKEDSFKILLAIFLLITGTGLLINTCQKRDNIDKEIRVVTETTCFKCSVTKYNVTNCERCEYREMSSEK